MREIKFRAKDKLTGQWIYAHGYYYDGINYWFTVPSETTPALALADQRLIRVETLGQFVGLKDRNGHEIFEGDTLQSDGEYGGVGEVRWQGIGFEFTRMLGPIFCKQNMGRFEVIGNIYETTPETTP